MGLLLYYVDTILVTLSLFLTIAYHGVLWHSFKRKPHHTTIGIQRIRLRRWVQTIIQDTDEKKVMLAVQSLRNTLMGSILAAIIAVLLNISLAALTNNAYNASNLLKDSFGAHTSSIIYLKYGLTSPFLLASFICSSMALGWLNEAIFFINSQDSHGYFQILMDRGFIFSFIGHRVLFVTVPLFLWLFGPIPMAVSSMVMVWVLCGHDFTKVFKEELGQMST